MVNTDVSTVMLYKNSTIATAKLINDTAICSACESDEELSNEASQKNMSLALPDDITETQEEQFLALLSHYLLMAQMTEVIHQ